MAHFFVNAFSELSVVFLSYPHDILCVLTQRLLMNAIAKLYLESQHLLNMFFEGYFFDPISSQSFFVEDKSPLKNFEKITMQKGERYAIGLP